MKADGLKNELKHYGELHVHLENDAEYHLHRHDVEVKSDGKVIVDSKKGRWLFDASAVMDVEYPHSERVGGE